MKFFVAFFIVAIYLVVFNGEVRGDEVVKNLRLGKAAKRASRRHLIQSKEAARDPCKELSLSQLFILKHRVEMKLLGSLDIVKNDKSLERKTRDRQVRAINLFRKEINETESLLYESVESLKRVLKGDYKSLRNLEKNSKQRLDELKKATLEEEQEYREILQAEKDEITELKRQGRDDISGKNTPLRMFINNLLNDLSSAADKLELQLDNESFQKRYHENNRKYAIETVLKLDEGDSQLSSDRGSVVTLIDSHNNQYVLSRAKDGTITHIDSNLIKDIIYIIIFSLAFSIPCSWLRLPNLFAYILTGIILGPSGINFLSVGPDIQMMLICHIILSLLSLCAKLNRE